ncbi:hypothetical protein EV191_1393 [Tamaricihabitans halophyticus]|uniref:DnaB helicase-like protein n=1 Tax=Tamaricihabitans halophyticus TaxID=1262583 RepID=A0A4R2PX63_9PSEU|nr:hypothetical protein [Tamaricihabitans halophyticus]TCP38761.1 hypothetical protein EV191_1393 [Tamaricihabitans halophyticus]
MSTEIATDAERGWLACVLHSPLPGARRLLAGMRATDCRAPIAQLVTQLAIELVADNQPPAPAAILAHAQTTGRIPALPDPGQPSRRDGAEHRHTQLTLWLANTIELPIWHGLGETLRTHVLELAWRRAIHEHATQLAHAATHSPTDILAQLCDQPTNITDLHHRWHTTQQPHSDPEPITNHTSHEEAAA